MKVTFVFNAKRHVSLAKLRSLPKANVWQQEKKQRAQSALDAAVIAAMRPYTPVAGRQYANAGKLRKTVDNSRPGLIRYTVRFARRQYYMPYDHSHSGNPRATRLWFEVAKRRHVSLAKLRSLPKANVRHLTQIRKAVAKAYR